MASCDSATIPCNDNFHKKMDDNGSRELNEEIKKNRIVISDRDPFSYNGDRLVVKPNAELMQFLPPENVNGKELTALQVMEYLIDYISSRKLCNPLRADYVDCKGDPLEKLLSCDQFPVANLWDRLKMHLEVVPVANEQSVINVDWRSRQNSQAHYDNSLTKEEIPDSTEVAKGSKPTLFSVLEKLKAQVQQQLDSVVGYETSTASEPEENDWSLEDTNYPTFELEPVTDSETDAPNSGYSNSSSSDVVEVISSIKDERNSADNIGDDDPEIGEKDHWKCLYCQQLNNPIARNCAFCWKLRENWLPSDDDIAVDDTNDGTLSLIPQDDDLELSTSANSSIDFSLRQESDSSGSESHIDSPVRSNNRNNRLKKEQRKKKHCKISRQLKRYKSASNKRLSTVDGMCMICLSEPRSASIIHINEGIGHQVCCYNCAEKLRRRRKKCPICRRPIELIVQNFIG
ncbi:uncharacterized protein TRIADDRAFT_54791 [Trichoplax adhaerens]|uniref:Uncharacterized protein n=1 Tax=Trichoplax adhaerens TaxID=10228 RepID=B3RT05_TRIAD|nr:hypothetical protein TRIADDRAFT_54791 [Trichoplax adhaerens]EDV27140.1 hypothetical protein TRIADDRAFT_54791 [Trichoplax adhaerens]|eukprot:XP_002111136.1 hypothetical protein TRIADDRAFT_54791 [Trichoplax adhaerens]